MNNLDAGRGRALIICLYEDIYGGYNIGLIDQIENESLARACDVLWRLLNSGRSIGVRARIFI